MNRGKWFAKSDIVLIIALAAAAALIYMIYNLMFFDKNDVKAEILLEGKLVRSIALDSDTIFSIPERENVTFEIKGSKIRISDSDCPDKICMHTGFIEKPMQTVVCLPNAISVRIVGKDEYNIDAVVG